MRVFAGTAECVAWSEEIQPVQRIANSIPVVLFDLLPKRVSAVIFVGNRPLVVGFVLRHRGTMMK